MREELCPVCRRDATPIRYASPFHLRAKVAETVATVVKVDDHNVDARKQTSAHACDVYRAWIPPVDASPAKIKKTRLYFSRGPAQLSSDGPIWDPQYSHHFMEFLASAQ